MLSIAEQQQDPRVVVFTLVFFFFFFFTASTAVQLKQHNRRPKGRVFCRDCDEAGLHD